MQQLILEHGALLADAVIAVLLVATIAYAAILDRKLSTLRAAKQEMAELVGRFGTAVARAENGLAEIRQTAEQTGKDLRQAIDKGNGLADDLVFLVERAGSAADRLEHSPVKRRGPGRAVPSHAAQGAARRAESAGGKAAAQGQAEGAPRSAERSPEQAALMAALRAMR
jgi:D-serine deaminase-like pyridoxal phosphate-dependent protein